MRQCRWLRYLIARGQTPAASDDSHAQGKSHRARNPRIRRETTVAFVTNAIVLFNARV